MRRSEWIAFGFIAGTAFLGIYYIAVTWYNQSTDRPTSSLLSTSTPTPELSPADVARSAPLTPEADPALPHDNTTTPPTLADAGGDTESPLAFTSKAVQAFTKEHPNSPLRFVPKDANDMQLAYLEGQAEVILSDWQQVRDELWSAHKENILAFAVDPSVIENDKTRQQRMKSLVQSLWPHAMP